MAEKNVKERIKRVEDHADFISKLVVQRARAAIGIMVSIHTIKEGPKGNTISHTFSYQDFPNGDWGQCLVQMGVEARVASLNAQTGASKV